MCAMAGGGDQSVDKHSFLHKDGECRRRRTQKAIESHRRFAQRNFLKNDAAMKLQVDDEHIIEELRALMELMDRERGSNPVACVREDRHSRASFLWEIYSDEARNRRLNPEDAPTRWMRIAEEKKAAGYF